MDKDWCDVCRTGKADFQKPSGTVKLCEEHMKEEEKINEETNKL